jgi:hypothetical protein
MHHSTNGLRYPGSTFTVYSSFETKNGVLVLEKANRPSSASETLKMRLNPRPATAARHPSLVSLLSMDPAKETQLECTRGVPSPLIKELGGANPHEAVTPLRQALYSELGLGTQETVKETWPTWGYGQVVWVEKVRVHRMHCKDMIGSPMIPDRSTTPQPVIVTQSLMNLLVDGGTRRSARPPAIPAASGAGRSIPSRSAV